MQVISCGGVINEGGILWWGIVMQVVSCGGDINAGGVLLWVF